MAKKRVGDFLALGLLLMSVALLVMFWNLNNDFTKFVGSLGAMITIIVEGMFLMQTWRKR